MTEILTLDQWNNANIDQIVSEAEQTGQSKEWDFDLDLEVERKYQEYITIQIRHKLAANDKCFNCGGEPNVNRKFPCFKCQYDILEESGDNPGFL